MAKEDKKENKEKNKPAAAAKTKDASKASGKLEDGDKAMLGFFAEFLSLGGVLLIIVELIILKFLEVIGVVKILIWNL